MDGTFLPIYSQMYQRPRTATFFVWASNVHACCRPEKQKWVADLDV